MAAYEKERVQLVMSCLVILIVEQDDERCKFKIKHIQNQRIRLGFLLTVRTGSARIHVVAMHVESW
jgi:hypothetical protein